MGQLPNFEWHRLNPHPDEPTHEQLMEWHLEHSKNCECLAVGLDEHDNNRWLSPARASEPKARKRA